VLGSGAADRKGLVEGPMLRPLLALSLPIMASNIMQTAYNVVDTFWLGRVGAEAVAALSISWPLIFLIISIAGGFSIAGTTLVSQYTGADDSERADHIASQVFSLLLMMGGGFSVIGIFMARPMLVLIGTPEEVLPLAAAYTQIIFAGIILMFGFYVFQAIISGWGDTVTPMKLMFLSTVLNIILDPFMILGIGPFPELGVAGAAIATVFSRGIASGIGFYYLLSGRKGIKVSVSHLRPERASISRIARIGIPSAVEQSTLALGFAFMAAIVAAFGTIPLAAYGIGTRLLSILNMPAMGFSMAVGIMVGQSLGAGKERRAARVAWLSAGSMFLVLAAGGLISYLLAGQLVSIFIVKEDYEVIEVGSRLLRIIALGLGPFAVRIVLNGAFRGAGDTVTAMALSIVALWAFRVPVAYALSLTMGTDGIWLSIPLSNFLGFAAASIMFKRGAWTRKSISGRGWDGTSPPPRGG
jgi:putative MATE family efflux protein